MKVTQKIKSRTTITSSNSTAGYFSKEKENTNSKSSLEKKKKALCTFMFITASFTIAKIWKHPKCPSIDEWIKKM